MSLLDYTDTFGEAYQRHALSVIARHPFALSRYRPALSHEYFTTELFRIVSRALLEYYDANKHLPTCPTLSQEAQNIAPKTLTTSVDPFVCKLFEDDIHDADGVIQRLVEFGKYSALCNAVLTASDKVVNKRMTLVERGQAVKEIVESALLVGDDVSDIGMRFDENIDARVRSYLAPAEEQNLIPTGIRHLDIALDGGLGRGCLGFIASPTGRGKTTLLCNFGFNAILLARNYNVVHFSMEMNGAEVIRKYDDRIIGSIKRWKVKSPDKLGERLENRIRNFARGILTVKSYSTRKAGVSKFRAFLNMIIANGLKPDMVIVDYADIVDPESRLHNEITAQAGVYEDLRAMAKDYDVACWTASQINRIGNDKDAYEFSDLAGAFEKSHIADVGIMLAQSRDEEVQNRCRIHLEKCRTQRDKLIVECDIRRDMSRIRSLGLYDSAANRLDEDGGGASSSMIQILDRRRESNQPQQRQPRRGGPTRRVQS